MSSIPQTRCFFSSIDALFRAIKVIDTIKLQGSCWNFFVWSLRFQVTLWFVFDVKFLVIRIFLFIYFGTFAQPIELSDRNTPFIRFPIALQTTKQVYLFTDIKSTLIGAQLNSGMKHARAGIGVVSGTVRSFRYLPSVVHHV